MRTEEDYGKSIFVTGYLLDRRRVTEEELWSAADTLLWEYEVNGGDYENPDEILDYVDGLIARALSMGGGD